jgi:hypothetical protein
MLSKSIQNLINGDHNSENIISPILIVFGSVTAGYTIIHFPYRVLSLFSHPVLQFVVFLTISLNTYYKIDKSINTLIYCILDAIFFTIVFQIIFKLTTPLDNFLKNRTPISKITLDKINIKYFNDGVLISGFLPTNEYSIRWNWKNKKIQVWGEKNKLIFSPIQNEPFTLFIPNSTNN